MNLEENLKSHTIRNLNQLVLRETCSKNMNESIVCASILAMYVVSEIASDVPYISLATALIFFISGFKIQFHDRRVDRAREILNYRMEQFAGTY